MPLKQLWNPDASRLPAVCQNTVSPNEGATMDSMSLINLD